MKSLRCLLLVTLTSLLIMSCKDEGTPPIELPEGYQQDIEWPSLADSPWPIYRADAQNTGRSKSMGPITAILKWSIDTLNLQSAGIIDEDSTIYFVGAEKDSGLYAISWNGEIKWIYKAKMAYDYPTAPVIGSDGTIYFYSLNNALYAINKNGTLKWKNIVNGTNQKDECITLGKDGTIYFLGLTSDCFSDELYALDKDGNIKWKTIGSFSDGISISPDGNTLYVSGDGDISFYSIDANSGNIIWQFNKKRKYGFSVPLVDYNGNIYTIAGNSNSYYDWYLYSLNSAGEIRWQFPIYQGLDYTHFTMDKYGNLYLGLDTLYSINYKGTLRWKIPLSENVQNPFTIVSPISCDIYNNIYFIANNNNGRIIFSFNMEGTIRFQIPYETNKLPYPSYSPSIGYSSMFICTRNTKTILKYQ